MRQFSKEQRAFIEAKALLETIEMEIKREVETRAKVLDINPWAEDEEEIERYVGIEIEIEEKFKYEEVRRNYKQAFWDLVTWGITALKKYDSKKGKELEPLLDPENKTFVWTRQEQLADTLMGLQL